MIKHLIIFRGIFDPLFSGKEKFIDLLLLLSVLAIHLKILKCCLPLLIYFRSLASCSSPEFSNADMPAIRQLIRKEIRQNYLTEQQSIVERHCEKFRRRFQNKDAATCWLNSSLQMILCAIDHSQGFRSQSNIGFKLELGIYQLSFKIEGEKYSHK